MDRRDGGSPGTRGGSLAAGDRPARLRGGGQCASQKLGLATTIQLGAGITEASARQLLTGMKSVFR